MGSIGFLQGFYMGSIRVYHQVEHQAGQVSMGISGEQGYCSRPSVSIKKIRGVEGFEG